MVILSITSSRTEKNDTSESMAKLSEIVCETYIVQITE